jgi:hypothetical protein
MNDVMAECPDIITSGLPWCGSLSCPSCSSSTLTALRALASPSENLPTARVLQ